MYELSSINVIFHENNACSAIEIIWILTDEKYAFKNFIFQFRCEADSTNNNIIKENVFSIFKFEIDSSLEWWYDALFSRFLYKNSGKRIIQRSTKQFQGRCQYGEGKKNEIFLEMKLSARPPPPPFLPPTAFI